MIITHKKKLKRLIDELDNEWWSGSAYIDVSYRKYVICIKLVLDDDRIIELNVEDYLNHENITTETDMSGYSTITLNNIKDIKIK